MLKAKRNKGKIIKFIKGWFAQNGKNAKAVIGISGGKDSSIATALCVEALGVDRVIGVLMPNGDQKDIQDAFALVNHLGIQHYIVNIKQPFDAMIDILPMDNMNFFVTEQLVQNLAPRIRMATLYAIAQGLPEGGRVINTCNRSEDYVGYSTKFGDSAGDISPLGAFTVSEVIAIGDICDIPPYLVHKTPADGLCGKSDEDNLGFSYKILDKYILTGFCENKEVKNKIDKLHQANQHKMQPLPMVKR